MPAIPRVSVPFAGISSNLDSNPETQVVKPKITATRFSEQNFGVAADGRATWSGPPDSSIGFIQLVTNDTRRGFYRAQSGKGLILDFARCTRPFLPCRDLTDAADGLSEPGEAGIGRFARVRVPFRDAPNHFLPLRVNDPVIGAASLERSHWLMGFVLLFGVRRGESFLPLEFLTWELISVRTFPGASPRVGPVARRITSGRGAPPGLLFESAMVGGTCRLRTRSMDIEQLRTPDDECPEIPRGRRCPPLVCAAEVTRTG